jgi:predicted small metal-binding protein
MFEFRCADSGTVCPALLRAFSKEELERQVAAHFRRQHRVKTATETLMNYLVGLAKPVAGQTSAQ